MAILFAGSTSEARLAGASVSSQGLNERKRSLLLKALWNGLAPVRGVVASASVLMLIGAFCPTAYAQTLQPQWVQQSPATAPPVRFATSLAYDSVHGQVVMFGGFGYSNVLNDTWLWNGTNWTQANPANSPSARSNQTMVYDATQGSVLLFGGSTSAQGSSRLNDTWVWDGTTWTQVSAANNPPARSSAAMAYDAATGQVVMFGGLNTSNADLGDTWVWFNGNWNQETVSPSPSARWGASMAYDAALGEVILFGGFDYTGNEDNDTWAWNGFQWTQLAPASSPSARDSAAMEYDPLLGQMVLYGGELALSGTELGDTWVLTGSSGNLTWTQQTYSTNPPARSTTSIVYDAAQGQLVMFGGFGATTTLGDTWTWGAPQNFGAINVCPSGQSSPAPCSSTVTLTYNASTTTDFGTPQVVEQGAPGSDFTLASSSTCSGTVTAGNSCTVNVTFNPQTPGLRTGAVKLVDSGNNLLATTPIFGIGEAPQLVFGGTAYESPDNGQYNADYTLNSPLGLAVDAAGDIFIANTSGGNVVKLGANSSGVSNVGSGLNFPESVAVDGAGDVFIGQNGTYVVEVPAGCTQPSCQLYLGTFSIAQAVAVNAAGDLFVADPAQQAIEEIPAANRLAQYMLYSPGGQFQPDGLAIDGTGNLFFADFTESLVWELPAGSVTPVTIGSGWSIPRGITVDAAGDLYVADSGLRQVVEVPAGCNSSTCEIPVVTPSQFGASGASFDPGDVKLDSQGNLYVSDFGNSLVEEIPQQTPAFNAFGSPTPTPLGSASAPQSVTFENIGNQTLNSVYLSSVFPGIYNADPFDFVQVPGTGSLPNCGSTFTLAPGAGCDLSISFEPQSVPSGGEISGGLQITDNSLNTSPDANQNTVLIGFSQAAAGATYPLGVTGPGVGAGTVNSTDGSITCSLANGAGAGGVCSRVYAAGATETLTATPLSGSTFAGWGGACASYGTNATCSVNVTAALSVTANFIPTGVFGSVSVCAGGNPSGCTGSSQSVTFNFTATTTVDGVQAVTQGTTGLDFSVGSSNTCTGTFNAGTSCTVAVNFTPLAPGLRLGAVELLNGFGAPFMTQPVYGVGLSAEAAFYSVGSPTAINLGSYLLSSPVAVDAAGNIYFAATGVVYKSTSGGIQTIGSGFATPGALAVDGVGNVFVADTSYGKVYEIPANGGPQTTVYSSGLVRGLAVDGEGDLFVADAVQNEVVEIPANGGANTVAFGPVTTGSVVVAVAVDAAGDVFAGLNFPGSIVEVPAGCNNTSCQVPVGAGWNTPSSLAVDAAGDLYVADSGLASGNGQIIQVTPGCQQTSCQFALADGGSIAGGVDSYGLALDSQGDVYYINTGYNIYGVGSGQATLNEITLSQPSVNFGVVSEGFRSADYPLMVQNIGNQTLTGSMGGVLGAYFFTDPSVSTCTTISLAPAATCVENFYATPTAVGPISANVLVSDNALNASPSFQTITLSAVSVGPAVSVTASGSGTGSGFVEENPTGINCSWSGTSNSGICSTSVSTGLTISLQENPTAGSTFTGWGGDCSAYGTSQICVVFVTAATNVTASFAAGGAGFTLSVADIGAGSGTVTDNLTQISCSESGGANSGTCSSSYAANSTVTLTASADPGSIFQGWGGACASSGTSTNCTVSMTAAESVTASFAVEGAALAGTLEPITAGVVYGQGGSFTTKNGTAGANGLNNPTATAVDANGNLYVADRSNSRVLFYPRGSTTATRVYGQNGSFTSTTPNNGGVTANSLGGEVFAVAVDPSGNLYIADGANNRVLFYPNGSTTATRVYGQGGSFTTGLVNNGGISANSLNSPQALAVDSGGNLYVGDTFRALYFPAGSTTATRVYGQGGSFTTNTSNKGGVSANSLASIAGMALDSTGGLYLSDQLNARVLYYPAGSTTATKVYGQNDSFTSNSPNNGGISANSLYQPSGLAVDNGNNLYVGDYLDNRILFYLAGSTTATRVYGQLGNFSTNAPNNGGVSANSVSQPLGISLDASGNLYAADIFNNRVLEYGSFGSGVNVCPSGQSTPAPCSSTITYSYNAPADTTFGGAQAVTQGTTGLDFSLGANACTGTVSAGSTCLVNVTFTPLAPGSRSGAVTLYDNNANPIATAPAYGIAQSPAAAFGPGTQTVLPATGLSRPANVALDAVGDVFVADYANNQIVKITPAGVQSTVPTTGLNSPRGVAVDGAGNLFISDAGNSRVVEIPAGCTTSACQVTVPTTGLNSGNGGLAVDGAGDIFIADTGNARVVKVTPGGVQTTVPATGLFGPFGVAVDAAGDVFIADTYASSNNSTNVVVEVTAGGVQTTVPTVGVTSPEGVWADAAGDVFVADSIPNNRIVEIPAGGGAQFTVYTGNAPEGVATDAFGDIFVADTFNRRVVEISRSQPPSYNFALTNSGSTSTDSPYAVSIQNVGNQLLTGSFVTSLGANFALDASSNCGGIELPPGQSCLEAFDFTPQTTGYLTGSASFSDNTFNLSPLVALQTVNLSGIGGVNGQAVTTPVPNVVGLTQAAAITALTSAGLTSGGVYTAASEIVPVGSVMASNPPAGTQVSLGSAVKVQVSNGQPVAPTPNPLSFENNYFVTGDYATGAVYLRGTGVNGKATGSIDIPDLTTCNCGQGVPDGADILDAFLYWETIENTATASGGSGTFLGYSISGSQIGSDIPNYTDGTLTGTLRAYRADVNNYFPANASGIRFGSGSFTVSLPDGGGTALPLTEGASLVVIYRVLSPNFPLKAVVIYDGSGVPTTSTSQTVQGFYDAAGPFANVTTFSTTPGSWIVSNNSVPLAAGASQYSASLSANAAYSAVILSTPVANSDNDGILNAWKAGPQGNDFYGGSPGYYDQKTGGFVALPGAKSGEKDLFVQMDYMCGNVLANGSCDPTQENLYPAPDAQGNDPLAMVKNAFAADGVVLHLQVGNAVPETTCTDSAGQLCQFPGEPGVIGWKNSLEFSKLWPRNFASCAAGGDCSPRFPYGQKDSYHYVLFGHSLAIPAWNSRYGSLTSINVSNGTTTIVTTDRGPGINACPSRITIAGVQGNPSLNGVYNTSSCADTKTMTLATPGVPNWSYPNNTLPEPAIGITSGTVTSISGYSDLGGADSAVTLALWETNPNQDMSKRSNVIAGTLFHEIGHTLGLSHGGLYYDTPGSYIPTFEANCKPNYQSVMNYLFQLDLVGPNAAVAYSNQALNTLNLSSLGSVTQLTDPLNNAATFATSAWYVPYTAGTTTASPATLHCDGTPLANDSAYRVDGPIAPITPPWSNGQNITFDGVPYTQLRGYNDVASLDLRQVGATGGEFASLAGVLSFGSSSTPLNVAAGGTVAMGSGGTVALGSGGTVALGSGGNVTLGSSGIVALGSGGIVTLGSGGIVTLGSGGAVTPGSNGTVGLPSGGSAALSSGGIVTLGSGGIVTLGSGGIVTLGSGGIIALGSGGNVTIPSTGGSYTIPSSGGIVTLGSGGTVALGSGGIVTLGSGGTITGLASGGIVTLGSGGIVALGSGGSVAMTNTLSAGGIVALGSGGTVALGSGGNVTLGSGGIVTLGSGGIVTMGSGGNVTLGLGGIVTLGSGGDLSVGSGGIVTLGSGGSVTLGSGGTVALGSGGNVTIGAGGIIAMGSGGIVTLGSGGIVTLGSGGATINGVPEGAGNYNVSSGGIIALGSGGTVALGSGGNVSLSAAGIITMGSGGTVALGSGGIVTLGSGGIVSLGSGGTVALGSGGTVALGSGGIVTLGSGGATSTELTFETANSVVRPPTAPTETPTPGGVRIDWTAPAFGVVSTYTILRSSDGATPIVIGSVSGVSGFPPATTFTDTNPDLTSQTVVYTITTTLVPDPGGSQRQSAQSAPAVLKNDQAIVLGPLPSSVSISSSPVMVTATAQSSGAANGLEVSFSATGACSIGSQSISSGVSSATLSLNSTGNCTVIASQAGNTGYNSADPVSGTFAILPQGSTTQPQTITFPQLQNVQYGGTFSLSASSSSGLAVSFTASGPCTTSGVTSGVGLCSITASAPASNTYSAASLTQSFTIFPAVIKVTAYNLTSVYGQALPALTYAYSGFVGNDTASVVSGVPALSTTATAASNPGTYPITVSTGTLATANYSFLYVNGTLTIQPATATISIANLPASAVYAGSFAPAYLYSGTGSPTKSVASTTTGVCTVSGGVVNFVGVGTCTLTASATATADDAAVTGSPQSFAVGQATPTISIGNIPASAVYGGSFTPAYLYSGTGSPTKSVASTTTGVCTVSSGVVNFVGVGTCTLTASATATTDDAAVTGSPQSFSLGQATATISIGNIPASAVYGGSFTPAYLYSGTGSPTKSVASTTTGVCTASSGVVNFVGVGTCTLTASATATTDDAAVTGSPQSFTVSQATQTVTFTQPTSPVTYGVSPIALSASATSGLTVAFSIDSSSTGTGTISGSTLTITGAGTLVIDANQAGNTDYKAAAQVQRSIVVNKVAQTIAFTTNPPASAAYNSTFTVAATASSGLAVTFSSSGSCSNSGSTYTMTSSTGTCSVIASQAGNANYTAATTVTKTVSASGPVITLSASTINFGTVYLDSISIQTVTVTNTGTAAATINQQFISILQAGSSNEYVIVDLCPSSLAAGKSCTIAVSFVAGAYYNTAQTATLKLMDNAPGNPQQVSLTAMVIDPLASFSPTSLSFGTIKHATSSTLDVTLSNPGATTLTFSGTGIGVTGTNAADFTQTNNCGSSLAAGAKCTIAVKFTPPATGTFSANLTVVDNAQAGSGTQTVALSGKGN